ncbi:hypothetical protein PVAND_006287 [Polypedilum vanderplanki]|uniref:Uncharacterized protein n=1 Tax=Polypedilum vanderplanki TaxID=319348 RepID=A0A9J6C2P7_POLVA|nr:hypothetical protein PVAND_006287 [Polypedilum vanderplanki]
MDIIRNLYLHKYSHKMFYKTKSSSSRSNSETAATVTTSQNNNNADGLRSQQFYIYSIDRAGATTININNMPPPPHLNDFPPSYEEAIKDPKYARREIV